MVVSTGLFMWKQPQGSIMGRGQSSLCSSGRRALQLKSLEPIKAPGSIMGRRQGLYLEAGTYKAL